MTNYIDRRYATTRHMHMHCTHTPTLSSSRMRSRLGRQQKMKKMGICHLLFTALFAVLLTMPGLTAGLTRRYKFNVSVHCPVGCGTDRGRMKAWC
jgi:hypothetical protein